MDQVHEQPVIEGLSPQDYQAISSLRHAYDLHTPSMSQKRSGLVSQLKATPRISLHRQRLTAKDKAFGANPLAEVEAVSYDQQKQQTVLYLAYGSNLSAETFLGKRGIKPLSQTNVVAPQIALSFDLPGIPYSEPCFGNTRYRAPQENDLEPAEDEKKPGYHKNAWKKGLVGVVYEVTRKDYAHIIATEGGGSGYQDVLIDCYELPSDPTLPVPEFPEGEPFKVHTLYAGGRVGLRTDPDYAQPSPRYLKLITDGAFEHDLPHEYRHFLENIRTFRNTTAAQRMGQFIFLSLWAPLFLLFFGGARIFLDKDGRYPAWYAKLSHALFTGVWASYDGFFFKTFGDGERTIGDNISTTRGRLIPQGFVNGDDSDVVRSEKTPLLKHDRRKAIDEQTNQV